MSNSSHRASLLAGLRTGGVRSTTNPLPHTAAPTVTSFPRAEMPMSASFNGSFGQLNSVQAQQVQIQAQQQALQMQMMQIEIMRLQVCLPFDSTLPLLWPCPQQSHMVSSPTGADLTHSLQALQQAQQQYKAELVRQQQQAQQQQQVQQQQQQQAVNRRASYYNEPMSAAPAQASFMNRHASQDSWQQAVVNPRAGMEEQVPMTASLGGKFGGRLNPNAAAFRMSHFPEEEEIAVPTPTVNNTQAYAPISNGHTTVISGGTALGLANDNAAPQAPVPTNSGMTASKSDTSLNWRRGTNNSVLKNGFRTASVNVKITPPPDDRVSPPLIKNRPEPLRFSAIPEMPITPLVIVDSSDGEATEDADDSSYSSKSEPTTPPSGGSSPLSPREAASKRLYEGLGLGRPVPHTAAVEKISFSVANGITVPHTSAALTFPRVISTPVRQPRGPPSGADELGPKNFASRIRRKAIGGLGAMLDARVNRREVEAY